MSNDNDFRNACAALIGYAKSADAIMKYSITGDKTEDLYPYLKQLLEHARKADAVAPWNQNKTDEQ